MAVGSICLYHGGHQLRFSSYCNDVSDGAKLDPPLTAAAFRDPMS